MSAREEQSSAPAGVPELGRSSHVGSPRPLKRFLGEVARFALVGGTGVVVNVAAFNFFREILRVPTVWSGVLATCTAIVTNYVGFRYYAYRERRSPRLARESVLFVVFSAIGLVLENTILYVGTSPLGWDGFLDGNLLKATGIVTAACFRFYSYRTWVFPRLRDAAEGARSTE